MSITRRLFLRNTAAAGAVAATAAPPVVAAEPEMTIRERALWHMRELERLAIADGASAAMVLVVGRPANWGTRGTYTDLKTLSINHHGDLHDKDGMFSEGGEA